MVCKYYGLVLLCLAAPLFGCGGLSQDDMRKYALSNDDEEEEETPVAAVAESSPVVEADTASSSAEAVASATPSSTGAGTATSAGAVAKAGPTSTPAVSGTAAAKAPSPPDPAPVTVSSAVVSGGDFDAPAPSALSNPSGNPNTTTSATSSPSAGASAEDEDPFAKLGPMPVLGSDPTNAEYEALRLWNLKRQQMEAAIEQRATQVVSAVAGGGNVVAPGVAATADNSPEYQAELVRTLFTRLTNPENLAPEELARVAQELAYAGTTKEALAFHHGWLLTTDKTDRLLKTCAWSPGLQRPLAAIHWGIGLEYTGPPQLLSSPNPIEGDSRAFEHPQRPGSAGKIKPYLGELGDRLLFGLGRKISTGHWGKLFTPPPPETEQNRTVALQWQVKPVGFNPESLGRGVTLLGGGSRKELMHFARLEGIDVLAIFDIVVRQPSNGPVVNTTTLLLWDVQRNRQLASTAALNNFKVLNARQDRSSKDPVEKTYDDLYAYIDNSLQLGETPQSLKEQHAKDRIVALAASNPVNPLATLAEMRYYHALGLVGDIALYEGYKSLLGDTAAKQLITGAGAERVGAISRFLPKVEPARQ